MLKKTIIFFYLILLVVLAVATFAENSSMLFASWWFVSLWALLSVLLVVALWRNKMWNRLPVMLLHVSFLVILIGAATTFFTSKKGFIHLRLEGTTTTFSNSETQSVENLPFMLALKSFDVQYYTGTTAPMNYVSFVEISGETLQESQVVEISMNKICKMQGYRLYQSSFDSDEQGVRLAVNYDPWGTPLAYSGYILLAISSIWLLISRRETFVKLLKKLLQQKISLVAFVAFILLFPNDLSAQEFTISREEADSMARTQIVYNNRIVPFGTLAHDVILKLYEQSTYKQFSAEQVVWGLIYLPELWKNEPIIRIKSKQLCEKLNLENDCVSLLQLFDNEEYISNRDLCEGLSVELEMEYSFLKSMRELDEKVALVQMLENGLLFRPLPQNVQPISEAKISAELLYNKISSTKLLFISNLVLGFVAFILLFRWLLQRISVFEQRLFNSLKIIVLLSFFVQIFIFVLRWFVAGRIPLSNGFETMQFLSLAILLITSVLQWKILFVVPFGFLLSGFALLVSYMGQMNPQITPLQPILHSIWLSSHVSLIMMSYALFAFMWLNGIVALCLRTTARKLMYFSKLLLFPAALFLGVGIFLGAIWANVSWGRYWAWDAKEVWALITFMVYAVTFHSKSIKKLRKPAAFHVFLVLAFLSVLMTYLGVNYLLGGLHSYAN